MRVIAEELFILQHFPASPPQEVQDLFARNARDERYKKEQKSLDPESTFRIDQQKLNYPETPSSICLG